MTRRSRTVRPPIADLFVIDLDLVNHGPDIGPREWRLARQDIRSHHPDEFSNLLLSDPRLLARFSEGAVEYDLRDAPLVFSAVSRSLIVASLD